MEEKEENIRPKNYLVIFIVILIGLAVLTLLDYTGNATKDPKLKLIVKESDREVILGDSVKASLVIYNIDSLQEISLTYLIKKIGSEEITLKKETLNINEETIIPLDFTIPAAYETGVYQLKVSIDGTEESATEIFQIVKSQKNIGKILLNTFFYLFILTILVTLIILTKKNWEWLKNIKMNVKQVFWNIKWSAPRKNFYLNYLYLAIVTLLAIIILLMIILKS